MNIVLVTFGSRGDVQPMVALTLGLQAAGHRAALAGPPERAPWARELGCNYLPAGDDFTAVIDGFDNVYRPTAALRFTIKVRRMAAAQFTILPALIRGADLVVGASLCFGLSSVAEAMGVPYRFVAFTPQLIPSAQHPCPVFKRHGRSGWWNRLSWHVLLFFDRFNFTRLINTGRRRLGLRPLSHAWPHMLGPEPLVATDEALAGLPQDAPLSGVQTGYLRLRQPVQNLPALEAFLAAGKAPLFAGFGSMPMTDQLRLFPMIKSVARNAGRRLVLARFWDSKSEPDSSGDVFYISRFPHEYLFSRMAAVIHHGGAGTTATAASSGVPQIIVPHALDQFYWGHRVWKVGIGSEPVARSALTAQRLDRAIRDAVDNPAVRENARAVKLQIQRTDGIQKAVQALLAGG